MASRGALRRYRRLLQLPYVTLICCPRVAYSGLPPQILAAVAFLDAAGAASERPGGGVGFDLFP